MPAPTDAVAGSRLPLAWRIFLLFAALIVLALGAVVLVAYQQGQRIASQAADQALAASGDMQNEFAERRLKDVQLKAGVIAADPAFVQYVSDAQGDGLGLGGGDVADSSSIIDLLRERQETYDFDLGVVLDSEGGVLARTDRSEALQESLAGDPLIEPVLQEVKAVAGYWRHQDKLYQIALIPLAQNEDLVGFLMVGAEVDDELGGMIGRVSGADVAFLLPSTQGGIAVIGTSLPPEAAEALGTAVANGAGGIGDALTNAQSLDRLSLDFAGQRWIGRLAPVDVAAGSRLGAVLQLTSSERAFAGYRRILNLVLMVGLIALVAALPISFLLAKATLRPLVAMAKAAKDAAAGNFQAHIALAGNDELAQLSKSFDSLLSNLREKSDIEGYVTNISRFLPDPTHDTPPTSFVTNRMGAETPAPPPPSSAQRETLVLAGIDFREFARSYDALAPQAVLDALTARVAESEKGARQSGGRLLASAGTRVVLGFAGEHRRLAALHAVHAALGNDGTAAALIEGDLVTGSLVAAGGTTPTAVGAASAQLDRLLSESGAGHVLLPRTLGDAAKGMLGEDRVGVVQGTVSGKPFYGIAAAALADLPPVPRSESEAGSDSTQLQPAVAAPPPRSASRSGDLVPGQRFGGRYEILSVLGSGGMGVVYKARDVELDDVVALKMLKPAALVDHEHLERLKSEIKLARKITHPNVLRTFDFGEQDGRPYVSMEYVRGMTLRYLLKQAGRIPYSAGLRIARQLCAGLAAAHEVGVLHRDIKPENLILEQSGNAKLMDFGIARPIRRSEPGHTQPGMFVGTPHYAAPEQLAGDDVDHRADIYSSGVLLCEMFCGKLPFTGSNTMEIYLAQMQATPIKPSAHWPEMPPALEAVILQCIERDVANRFQSAQDLATALAQLRA